MAADMKNVNIHKRHWREKAEGTLENLDWISKHRKLKLRDCYKILWAIGAALVSISYTNESE